MSAEQKSALLRDVPLAPLTSMGLGGRARYLASCQCVEEIRDYLAWGKRTGQRLQVLGGGSNTIFPDTGFDGLVLKIELRGIHFEAKEEWVEVTAGAGEDWDGLVQQCIARGLSGIECLSGIPGLVGATPIQNVGAYGQEVGDTLTRVEALDRESLEIVEFSNEDCCFSYRQSCFKTTHTQRYIITAVSYRLPRDGQPQLRYPELRRFVAENVELERLDRGAARLGAVREAVLHLRRQKSMVLDPTDPNARSAGSFFLNPILTEKEFTAFEQRWKAAGNEDALPGFSTPEGIKVPAAWLVEQAGFPRGFRRGGVGISARHALALINGGGTTRELLELATEIQGRVDERFGLRLEIEPVVVEALS